MWNRDLTSTVLVHRRMAPRSTRWLGLSCRGVSGKLCPHSRALELDLWIWNDSEMFRLVVENGNRFASASLRHGMELEL